MITVTFYYREQCPECDQVRADLEALQAEYPHRLVSIDVDHDKKRQSQVGDKGQLGPRLPILEIGPYHLQPPFTRQDLQVLLRTAINRVDQLEKVDQDTYQKRVEEGLTLTTGDRITHFLSHHYLAVVNLLILLYVGLPFLAPVLEKNGATLPANVIYRVYGAMCHQLAFRSFFLFGEQPYYPRALAGVANVIPYEKLVNSNELDLVAARAFTGNPVTGYKVALCERDVAIYAFMLLFGLAFWASGRRFRSIPWYAWVLIGLVPIGVDGVSQLPSAMAGLPAWLPIRESTPLLRVLTGGLFGWMTAWYLFPMLEETATEARRIMQRKIAVIQQSGAPKA